MLRKIVIDNPQNYAGTLASGLSRGQLIETHMTTVVN